MNFTKKVCGSSEMKSNGSGNHAFVNKCQQLIEDYAVIDIHQRRFLFVRNGIILGSKCLQGKPSFRKPQTHVKAFVP